MWAESRAVRPEVPAPSEPRGALFRLPSSHSFLEEAKEEDPLSFFLFLIVMHSSTVLFRFTVLAIVALVATAEYDDNSVYAVGGVPVAVDLDYFSNYVKKGGPQGPLRFGKRRGPSGPLRFGKRSFHAAPEDVVPWYQ